MRKIFQEFALIVSLVGLTSAPCVAQVDGLPDSGTYFIVNGSSGEALQPNAPSAGQNVMVHEFNKGGTQKWVITRKINPATKKPTNRYTIRLAGEAEGLNLQPHPSVPDAATIVSSDTSVFTLETGDGGCLVKSVARNGDALKIYPSPPSTTETRFAPADGSTKFRWNFIKTE